jgi:hypothetical protein
LLNRSADRLLNPAGTIINQFMDARLQHAAKSGDLFSAKKSMESRQQSIPTSNGLCTAQHAAPASDSRIFHIRIP